MIFEPFLDVPDPDRYVPRESSDRALAQLVACVRSPGRPCAVVAPAGLGKTLALHTLPRLVPELVPAYVPNPVLAPEDLCAWTLGRLGLPAWRGACGVLEAYLEHLAQLERALLWLVDDAHLLPVETARWLRRQHESRPSLRLVVGGLDPLSPELGDLVRVDALGRPMTVDETRRYLEQRLRLGEAEGTAPDDDAVSAIHRAAGGIPREVSARAAERLGKDPSWTGIRALV